MTPILTFAAGSLCTLLTVVLIGRHICHECGGHGTLGCTRVTPNAEGEYIRSDWTEPCYGCNGWRIVRKQKPQSRDNEVLVDGKPLERVSDA